eukprot:COSAG01_NODE_822_length_13306_cov_4.866132_5_plen_67_part_00
MHILEAADEDSQPLPIWNGITGRVKQLLAPTNEKVEDLTKQMEATRQELTGKVDELKSLLQELLAK